MNTYQTTRFLMKKFDIHPNKRLGQNFLVDEFALEVIAEDVNKDDIVVEIGPGIGNLTELLCKKTKKVIAIEVDKKMLEILEYRFKLTKNIDFLASDVLKLDIDKLGENLKIVANLPYYITTKIILKILESKNVKEATILIQKEVADRITADYGTKTVGAITYLVNYYADSYVTAEVSRECFIPQPEVTSSVLKIEKLKNPRVKVKDEKLLFNLIRTSFSKRRKNILNSLSDIIDKNDLRVILKKLNIDENVRGETLSLEDFANIANKISEK